jgi:ribosomal protein L11 methylase PrmA
MIEAAEIIRDPASFRDPCGFIFQRDESTLRQVNECYAADYDQLMMGGLYDELVGAGLLLAHEELPLGHGATEAAYKVLRPVQLPLVSYPYEWSFSQLRDAALVTLEIQRRALAKGMTLKDASAYNIQLFRGKPLLIDTLSLERYQERHAWGAYRQFCQHFLAPLALMSRIDVRLNQLLRIHLDGVPLDLASRLLPWRSKFSLSLGLHIHAHSRSQRWHSRPTPAAAKAPAVSRRNLEAIVASLEAAVTGMQWSEKGTAWSDYYAAGHNYGTEGMDAKAALVRELICQVKPRTVWDLGANDGRFSRIAAECGAETVAAWDMDPACVENNYRQVVAQHDTVIYPLLLDLTNPTPGVGWANRERSSFAGRGPVDLELALGLIHHLAIANNSPLSQIAAYLASLTKWLIVEWVPKEDSQVQKLLNSREDIFSDYSQGQFEAEFRQYFTLERKTPIAGTKRTLYLLGTLDRWR